MIDIDALSKEILEDGLDNPFDDMINERAKLEEEPESKELYWIEDHKTLGIAPGRLVMKS